MTAQGVTIGSLTLVFNSLFHSKESPIGLAIFRICFGVLLTIESVGLIEWGGDLFGYEGLGPTQKSAVNRFVVLDQQSNLFSLGGASDRWIRLVFITYSISCLFLAAGLFTRLAAFSVFLNLASRSKQNWYVIQGGDNLAKFLSFLLVFSNAGAALSLDLPLKLEWMYGTTASSSQWPQRLMQIQVSIVYLRTVFWKLKAHNWLDGTAVFHAIYRNPHFRLRSLPIWFFRGPVIALMTWSTLVIEFAAGTLLWFRETRYPTMTAVVMFHLSMELFLTLKYFQVMMIVCMLLFVPGDDWTVLAARWHTLRQ